MPEVDIIEIDGNLVYRQAFSEVARLLRRYQAAQGRLDHLLALPLPDVDPWPRAAVPSVGRPTGQVSDPTHRRVDQIDAAWEDLAERRREIAKLQAQVDSVDRALEKLSPVQRDIILQSVMVRSSSPRWRSPGGIGEEHGYSQSAAYRQRTLALYTLASILLPPDQVYARHQGTVGI